CKISNVCWFSAMPFQSKRFEKQDVYKDFARTLRIQFGGSSGLDLMDKIGNELKKGKWSGLIVVVDDDTDAKVIQALEDGGIGCGAGKGLVVISRKNEEMKSAIPTEIFPLSKFSDPEMKALLKKYPWHEALDDDDLKLLVKCSQGLPNAAEQCFR